MPTSKFTDDIPLTGEKVWAIAYLEARLDEGHKRSAIEIQSLREMLLRFREDAAHALATRLDERDLRYQQRFSASQEALNAALLAADRAIQAALLSQKEAVAKAELASEARFSSVNEFRQQLADQTSTFIPRTEAAARFTSLSEKLDLLSSRIDKSDGSGSGISKSWAVLVSGIGLIGTLVAVAVVLSK